MITPDTAPRPRRRKRCADCGQRLDSDALDCRHCGEQLHPGCLRTHWCQAAEEKYKVYERQS